MLDYLDRPYHGPEYWGDWWGPYSMYRTGGLLEDLGWQRAVDAVDARRVTVGPHLMSPLAWPYAWGEALGVWGPHQTRGLGDISVGPHLISPIGMGYAWGQGLGLWGQKDDPSSSGPSGGVDGVVGAIGAGILGIRTMRLCGEIPMTRLILTRRGGEKERISNDNS